MEFKLKAATKLVTQTMIIIHVHKITAIKNLVVKKEIFTFKILFIKVSPYAVVYTMLSYI